MEPPKYMKPHPLPHPFFIDSSDDGTDADVASWHRADEHWSARQFSGRKNWSQKKDETLVGGLEHDFIFTVGNNHPNRLSYFSEGWLNHQPENVTTCNNDNIRQPCPYWLIGAMVSWFYHLSFFFLSSLRKSRESWTEGMAQEHGPCRFTMSGACAAFLGAPLM